jgi:hypothetical protein
MTNKNKKVRQSLWGRIEYYFSLHTVVSLMKISLLSFLHPSPIGFLFKPDLTCSYEVSKLDIGASVNPEPHHKLGFQQGWTTHS